MQIEQYISDLLYRHECVILPGFGAFLTQYYPAQVHETTQAFYPPKKRLSFNANLIENDGLLGNYIARAQDVPYEEATAQIAIYVRQLWDELHKGATLELKNIGLLRRNDDGFLHFEASYHLNYLTDSFGLASFTSPAVQREEDAIEIAIASTATVAFSSDTERRPNKWIGYAAAAVVGLSLLGLGSFKYSEKVEEHNIAAEESVKNQIQTKIQESTFVINNPLPAITLQFAQPSGKYHIVGGAFRQEENAVIRVNQLVAKGYKARQIGTNSYGLHQVVYNSYTDRIEALQMLRKVRREDNRDAWLLVKELN